MGKSTRCEKAHDLQKGLDEAKPHSIGKIFVLARWPRQLGSDMGWRIRQLGVVIGLTVILTFPVTVFSRTESPTQLHHVVAAIGGKRSESSKRNGWYPHGDQVARPAASQRVMHATATEDAWTGSQIRGVPSSKRRRADRLSTEEALVRPRQ